MHSQSLLPSPGRTSDTASSMDISRHTESQTPSCLFTHSSPLGSPFSSSRRAGARMLKCLAIGCHHSQDPGAPQRLPISPSLHLHTTEY